MPQVSIATLFENTKEKLSLTWVSGKEGAERLLDSERIAHSSKGLIGHLNFLHPNWIQVLSDSESDYINHLDAAPLQQLAESEPACFVVAGGITPPSVLRSLSQSAGIPLLATQQPSMHVMAVMRHYLNRVLAESTTRHGVFLDVLGMGVLMTGESGVGKSELGLELISRGGGLVADDIVELYRIAPDTLEGRCPALLKDFLEVRGLGVLNIRTIFGETAVRPKKNLKLIVNLERPSGPDFTRLERLPLNASSEEILGVSIRKVSIPVAAGRNLAVLVEAAVRNYVLQLRGIDSTQEFLKRHEQHMEAENGKKEDGS